MGVGDWGSKCKTIYYRKGTLNEKVYTVYIFMQWRKRNHEGEIFMKKIHAARKFPTPIIILMVQICQLIARFAVVYCRIESERAIEITIVILFYVDFKTIV